MPCRDHVPIWCPGWGPAGLVSGLKTEDFTLPAKNGCSLNRTHFTEAIRMATSLGNLSDSFATVSCQPGDKVPIEDVIQQGSIQRGNLMSLFPSASERHANTVTLYI